MQPAKETDALRLFVVSWGSGLRALALICARRSGVAPGSLRASRAPAPRRIGPFPSGARLGSPLGPLGPFRASLAFPGAGSSRALPSPALARPAPVSRPIVVCSAPIRGCIALEGNKGTAPGRGPARAPISPAP